MELTVAVVASGLKEVGQYIVDIRRADQLTDRKAHQLSNVRCKDVSKVSGGNAEIDGITVFDSSAVHKIAVRRDVIYDLRGKTTPVYRVCA